MDRIVEGLELVEEVNGLVQNLQESLELFNRGEGETALEKIRAVKRDIDNLEVEELPDQEDIEEKLSAVRTNLEWVSQNGDRVKKGGED